MATKDFSEDKSNLPTEKTQGQEFATDREETPSADWVQQTNEETIVYSEAGKPQGITESGNIKNSEQVANTKKTE